MTEEKKQSSAIDAASNIVASAALLATTTLGGVVIAGNSVQAPDNTKKTGNNVLQLKTHPRSELTPDKINELINTKKKREKTGAAAGAATGAAGIVGYKVYKAYNHRARIRKELEEAAAKKGITVIDL